MEPDGGKHLARARLWPEYIEQMFCEKDNLQMLCLACHSAKSAAERKISTERARQQKKKEQND
jgi:hypothetical protein